LVRKKEKKLNNENSVLEALSIKEISEQMKFDKA